jgi:flagellar hook-basal body complex protein FliE
MVNAIQSVNSIKSASAPSGAAGSVGETGKFKQLLNQAIEDQVGMDMQKAGGIVEELTPEMASQFFAQIVPNEEFNPKIETLDSRGRGVTATAKAAQDYSPELVLAQAPANPAPVSVPATGQDPNQQAVNEQLSRPIGLDVQGGTTPGARPPRIDVTPFQFFLDKAVDFFLKVSDLERKGDIAMVDYAQGRASLEEVMVEKAKVSVALSFSITLINQVTQSFKEIQNMQV